MSDTFEELNAIIVDAKQKLSDMRHRELEQYVGRAFRLTARGHSYSNDFREVEKRVLQVAEIGLVTKFLRW